MTPTIPPHQLQLNEQGQLRHFLTTEGLSRELLTEILDTADSFVSVGKQQVKKDLTAIAAAHGIPYAATATPQRARDLMQKVQKAVSIDGPCFLNVLAPCPRGWRFKPGDSMAMCKLAVETCVWPVYEIENGKLKINAKPREKKPVEEWLKSQGRFKHLFTPKFEHLVAEIQADVDRKWEQLLKREESDKQD